MSAIDLAVLRPRIDAAIEEQLRRAAEDLAELAPESADLLGPITALLRGGKRLRPLFLYLGYRAAGRPDSDAAVRLAAAMEFVQAAALIHDDVIDASDTRRGMPTTHRALEATHRARGWAGDAASFGVAGAILAGNLCLGWADQSYDECGLPDAELAGGRRTFDLMRAQLMAGQYLDVVSAVRPWAGLAAAERVATAERVITYKSAKYSIQHPLLIGARTGGVSRDSDGALTAYGLELGIAFQLRDDLLGVFGDPDVTGKPAGDDLREGKRTVLVAHTLAGLDPAGQAEIEGVLGDPGLTPDAVDRARELITASGAVELVEGEITRRADAAAAALHTAPIAQEARVALGELIATATARSS
ncbi:MAG: polyprenyl synthetase family protein [Actinobacteria bacterium]|nr:polyprenyl synthetase family protein [Actinomycetota bacterium]